MNDPVWRQILPRRNKCIFRINFHQCQEDVRVVVCYCHVGVQVTVWRLLRMCELITYVCRKIVCPALVGIG